MTCSFFFQNRQWKGQRWQISRTILLMAFERKSHLSPPGRDLWLVLHNVDHCLRFLASVVIPNKQPKTIVKSIFKNWIIKHGSSNQIKSNIWFIKQVPTTQWWWVAAAESPWSKSVTERHNQILADVLDKVLEKRNCDLNLAVAWCINAKNSLSSILGFFPYQLAIGTSPKLAFLTNSSALALTATPLVKSYQAICWHYTKQETNLHWKWKLWKNKASSSTY